MSSLQSNEVRFCPQCGAALPAEAKYCWLCSEAPVPVGIETARPRPVREPQAAYQFGLSALMLTVTLFAVLYGVFRMAPGLGVVLAIVVTPVLVRTHMAAARRKGRGRPMIPSEKVGAFAGSVGVVVIIGVGAGAAFFATCWAIPLGVEVLGRAAATSRSSQEYRELIILGVILGAIIGLVPAGIVGRYVGYRLIRRFWPRKD